MDIFTGKPVHHSTSASKQCSQTCCYVTINMTGNTLVFCTVNCCPSMNKVTDVLQA